MCTLLLLGFRSVAIVCTGDWRGLRYGAGSVSDRARGGEGSFDAPGSLTLPVPYRLLICRPIWRPIKTEPADVGSYVTSYMLVTARSGLRRRVSTASGAPADVRSLPLAVLIQSAPCEIQILLCRAYSLVRFRSYCNRPRR